MLSDDRSHAYATFMSDVCAIARLTSTRWLSEFRAIGSLLETCLSESRQEPWHQLHTRIAQLLQAFECEDLQRPPARRHEQAAKRLQAFLFENADLAETSRVSALY